MTYAKLRWYLSSTPGGSQQLHVLLPTNQYVPATQDLCSCLYHQPTASQPHCNPRCTSSIDMACVHFSAPASQQSMLHPSCTSWCASWQEFGQRTKRRRLLGRQPCPSRIETRQAFRVCSGRCPKTHAQRSFGKNEKAGRVSASLPSCNCGSTAITHRSCMRVPWQVRRHSKYPYV